MPFEDLEEQAFIFDQFDALANQANQKASIDFNNLDYVLMRRLYILAVEIQEMEVKHGVRRSGSLQFAIVRNLIWGLEDCSNARELKVALPSIKEALLKAWVIMILAQYDALVPVLEEGRAYLERQKRAGLRRWEEDQVKHEKWRKLQVKEEDRNPHFRSLKSKQAKAKYLKRLNSIAEKVATIAKQIEPRAVKKK